MGRKKVTRQDLDSWVISEANIDDYYDYLSDLADDDEEDSKVAAAHKTVSMFSNLMGKELDLQNGKTACTDGRHIIAPFKDKGFYEIVEHEIAHNLFNSNISTAQTFVERYVCTIEHTLRTFGLDVSKEGITSLSAALMTTINIVEDHRVNSLWARLYPGSYKRLYQDGQDRLSRNRRSAHNDLMSYMLCVSYDVNTAPGRYDRFRPSIINTLKSVEGKGPSSTYILTKRLLADIVTELIRIRKDQPPRQDSRSAKVQTDLDRAMGKGQAGGDSDSQEGASESSDSTTGTTPEERAQAMLNLLEIIGDPSQGSLRSQINKLGMGQSQMSDPSYGAVDLDEVASINANDNDALNKALDASEQEADTLISAIEDKLFASIEEDEDEKSWVSRNVAGVRIVDVNQRKNPRRVLSPEGNAAVSRLKQLFQQVKNKRNTTLQDSGFEVDIQALIANRSSGRNDPVFKADSFGRGFKVLVLVDRSSSMCGSNDRAVSEALTILQRSMKDPQISMDVWGFHGGGLTVISRVKSGLELDIETEVPATGSTPLLESIKCAVNYLHKGSEKKFLVVLTDGQPNGGNYDEIRKEVERARKIGVATSALVIGSAFSEDNAKKMFGNPRNWQFVEEGYHNPNSRRNTVVAMVDLVRSAFVAHQRAA